jgi:hypothetical protein
MNAASILALVESIERRGADAPAAPAFRSALKRKGADAYDNGGAAAVGRLLQEVVAADPDRADTRATTIRPARADLLPGPGERAQP